MKPILYSHSETSFTSNGLGRLSDCISCNVTEERNGIYECQFTYPVSGEMYSKIQIGCILGVIHDDAKDIQPFDIYAKGVPINGVVTFYAHHVSYRLGYIILRPMQANSISAAFASIPNNTYNSCPFTFWTDKAVSAQWSVNVPSAVKAVLGGETGSILDVYGKGEYMWDKFTVRLYVNRGNDNGVAIRYGVNLTDIQQDFDLTGTYNAVAPYWYSQEGTLVTLPEGYIAATSVTAGQEILPVPMDLTSVFQEQPTVAQLRAEALRLLDGSEAWTPQENITVKFVDLAHTEQYKDVAALQRVRLCDKVSVYCGPLGVNAVKMKVIKTVYNVLLEEYDEIELGDAKTSFTDTLMAKVEQTISELTTRHDVNSMLQAAIDNATRRITGAQNSHVRFIYDANGSMQEIVVMDTDSITTATKVWRWNSAGLGHSSNGYAGPYALAMTQDGAIVADFITSGTMSANRISGGVIDGETIFAKLLNIINADNEIIASFDDTITLGKPNKGHFDINANHITLTDINGTELLYMGDERDENGIATITVYATGDGTQDIFYVGYIPSRILRVTVDGIALNPIDYWKYGDYANIRLQNAPAQGQKIVFTLTTEEHVNYFCFGIRAPNTNIGKWSFAEGESIEASGQASHAEGQYTIASGTCSHAEGLYSKATSQGSHAEGQSTKANGTHSHAEGFATTSDGIASHAEGTNTIASGAYSHAEGFYTAATGTSSHAEGLNTAANYEGSHAEGQSTEANGAYSHAEGYHTIANGIHQHVVGSYNVPDTTSIEIVGGGNNSTRRNIRTLATNGNEWIAGTLTQGSDQRLKEESGEIPDLSGIRARRFKWNDEKGPHDDLDHIGYFAQEVEEVAPYLVQEDAMGYKSLDYIALLCAKVEYLERRIKQLESEVNHHDD